MCRARFSASPLRSSPPLSRSLPRRRPVGQARGLGQRAFFQVKLSASWCPGFSRIVMPYGNLHLTLVDGQDLKKGAFYRVQSHLHLCRRRYFRISNYAARVLFQLNDACSIFFIRMVWFTYFPITTSHMSSDAVFPLGTQLISSAKTILIASFFCKRLWPRAKNGAPKLIRKAVATPNGTKPMYSKLSRATTGFRFWSANHQD